MKRISWETALAVLSLAVVTSEGLPQITNYDKVKTLKEGTSVDTALSTITCTDTGGAATRTLVRSVSPGSPCGTCFVAVDCGSDSCLVFRASGVGKLDHASAGSYVITVSCDNGSDPPATEVIMIIIIPNTPPKFDSATLSDDVSVSAAVGIGRTVAQSPATDDDGDTLSYSLSVAPTSAHGAFAIDTSGTITALIDLRTLCRSFVTLEVTVSDGQSTTGPKVINLSFTNNHVKPVAINLNTEVHVREDTALKEDIYTYKFVPEDNLVYTVTSRNTDGFAQFDSSKKTLSVAKELNYEEENLRITDLVISAKDDYCESDTYTLRIKVTDVNEAPVISNHRTSIEICEGRTEFIPSFTMTDEDEEDTHLWTYFGGNNKDGIFFVNPETGVLGTNLDYDVDPDYDKPKKYAARFTYKIEVHDKGGLTATATVSATFLDCNDNAPRFTKPFFTFMANECTAPGSTLGRLTAIDADSDREGNNVITYSGAAGAVEVGGTGAVIMKEALPAGTVLVFDAYATDQGLTPGPLRSEQPAKVSVIFGVCPPPASSDDSGNSSGSSDSNKRANMSWIIVVALLGAVFLGLLAFMLWRYSRLIAESCSNLSCKNLCRRDPPQRTSISTSSRSRSTYY